MSPLIIVGEKLVALCCILPDKADPRVSQLVHCEGEKPKLHTR